MGDDKVWFEGERSTDGTARARVGGELDLGTGDRVGAFLTELVGDDIAHLELDLADVGFIDSVGLRVLIDVRERLVRRGGGAAIVAASDHATRLLSLTGLSELFAPAT